MPLKIKALMIPIFVLYLLCGVAQIALAMGKGVEPPRITKEELLPMLGNPDVVILDVREGESWKNSKWKIQGAVREDPLKEAKTWADNYPRDKTLVLYCS